MKQAVSFTFTNYSYEKSTGVVQLNYRIDFNDASELIFTEKVHLPVVAEVSQNQSMVLEQVLQMLHILCGLTYWKLYCPPEIYLEFYSLTKDQATFWDLVYTKGLGEFFYRNKLSLKDRIHFPYKDSNHDKSIPLDLEEKAFISIGGGKDSIVLYELLKEAHVESKTYILETNKKNAIVEDVLRVMNREALEVNREIDPLIFELNREPGTYNGHIPITAIYSVVGVVLSVLYGYKYVIMANERSANYGNVEYDGMEINHQWSKSEEFETAMRNYIHECISPSIEYFSLLRPLSELKITELFSHYPEYFHVFSSCNRNFKIAGPSLEGTRWCGECPKCAFVFAMLSAFISKKDLIDIFGKNMFADESLLPLYQELLGIKDFKPFECVGTPEEVQVAFYKAYEKGEYKDDVIMKYFESNVLPSIKSIKSTEERAMSNEDEKFIPEMFKKII